MQKITVIKQDLAGQETWRYEGRVLARGENEITVEALFNRDDTPFHEISLLRGDRFVETYYDDRWYNIFRIHDRGDDRLKGIYCNVCYPAVITGSAISYVDLALDLLVYPDRRQIVLDEDEFSALPLPPEDCRKAREALEQLKRLF
ncbi:MAG TPA: DUF402 domain-containing protein [Anaerolineales bacterium]|nr:DUF402 domain-containing protein [Anaerolineales bacterium]